jgi:hypothetical protein
MYRIATDIRSTSNEDGGTVLDIAHSQIFHVNAVGALILDALRQGCSESEIAALVSHRYVVNEQTALVDVHEFLESLRQHQLISMVEGKGDS